MKATIKPQGVGRHIPESVDRMRLRSVLNLVVLHDGRIRNPITARFYMAPSGGRTHCTVFVHWEEHHHAGYAAVGGYGYHRASAALQSALEKAGISIDEEIAGRGDGAMESAMNAIADAIGCGPVRYVVRN